MNRKGPAQFGTGPALLEREQVAVQERAGMRLALARGRKHEGRTDRGAQLAMLSFEFVQARLQLPDAI